MEKVLPNEPLLTNGPVLRVGHQLDQVLLERLVVEALEPGCFQGFYAKLIASSNRASSANPVHAEIPFDNILDRVTGSDPSVTDYILEEPAKCP